MISKENTRTEVPPPETHAGRYLLALLLAGIFVLAGLHVSLQLLSHAVGTQNIFLFDLAGRMHMDYELSLPTWYTSFLAVIGGFIAVIISRHEKVKQTKMLWAIIGGVMIFVSADEVAALHELALQTIHITAGYGEGQTLTANAWLLALPFIFTGAATASYWLYRQMPSRTFRRLMIAGVVYLSGALAVEYLSIPVDKTLLRYNALYATVEEFLELLGLWLVIRALLLHVKEEMPLLNKQLLRLTKR